MIERKPGRVSDEALIRQLWAERFPFGIPASTFINTWIGLQSMFVISAFNNAERFYHRYPSKTAEDCARLISSTISKSRRIQADKEKQQWMNQS